MRIGLTGIVNGWPLIGWCGIMTFSICHADIVVFADVDEPNCVMCHMMCQPHANVDLPCNTACLGLLMCVCDICHANMSLFYLHGPTILCHVPNFVDVDLSHVMLTWMNKKLTHVQLLKIMCLHGRIRRFDVENSLEPPTQVAE